ncbi:hypothetical protein BD410DRAFT_806000 [Rickenella mellea]|uniref:Uncharacterized protein n=1 Tax=Rickenella mellea TaxID=50990 RepID=A0A4Y7PWS1_9AGAM|nr:hypothetical protein BD410DRAFT_806000 [Rickenella mellea]
MKKVGLRNGLVYFVLRDDLAGVIQFCAREFNLTIAGFNCLDVIYMLGRPLNFVLINRLVLNLRQASHIQGCPGTLGALGSIEEPAFASNSLLGNLGAPLRIGPERNDEFEEIDDGFEVAEECGIVDISQNVEQHRSPSDV